MVLILLLSADGCSLKPAALPEPLVLPYTLYNREFEGSQVMVTLDSNCNLQTTPASSSPCCIKYIADFAREQTRFGVHIITVVLDEGYQQGDFVDWNTRLGGETGSGNLWVGEFLAGEGGLGEVACSLDASTGYPVAVFVRLAAAAPDDPGLMLEETIGPLAVLGFLADGQGIIRLGQ